MLKYLDIPDCPFKDAVTEFYVQHVTNPSNKAICERMLIAGLTKEEAKEQVMTYAKLDEASAKETVEIASNHPLLKKKSKCK